MDRQKEMYRQRIAERLRLWEYDLIRLRSDNRKLASDARPGIEATLREMEACIRTVFDRYTDLLMADDRTWDERRMTLDSAADTMEAMFIDFKVGAV